MNIPLTNGRVISHRQPCPMHLYLFLGVDTVHEEVGLPITHRPLVDPLLREDVRQEPCLIRRHHNQRMHHQPYVRGN